MSQFLRDFSPFLYENETLPDYMNTWLQSHYGKQILRENVRKGENTKWYMDQRVVSIQINNFSINVHNVYTRKKDRVDRRTLTGWENFKSRKDCHMYHPSFSDTFCLLLKNSCQMYLLGLSEIF